jgi:hypothetical protein
MEKQTEIYLSKNFIFKNQKKNEKHVNKIKVKSDQTLDLMKVICSLSNEEIATVNLF